MSAANRRPAALGARALACVARCCPLGRRRRRRARPDGGARRAALASPPRLADDAPGSVLRVTLRLGGSPPFALVGRRIVVRGIVTPYVAGQTVEVSFYLEAARWR